MSINIQGNYHNKLYHAKPNIINSKGPKDGLYAQNFNKKNKKHINVIPPLNTSIQFNLFTPQFKLPSKQSMHAINTQKLPKNFNWIQITDEDSDEIKKKKKLITKPPEQALCGSCWAISVAGVISDLLVISETTDWFPNVSTTWSLSNYPQSQCNGGNPAKLINDISIGGVASEHCIDYSWCIKNDICNGSSLDHFDQSDINLLNSKIPDPGCYYNNEQVLYKVGKNSSNIYLGMQGVTIENFSAIVKNHIYTIGPVVGGYVVFENFMSGNFDNINGGIYLENGIYDNIDNDQIQFSPEQSSSSKYRGSHAVAIIGWGESEIIIDNNGTKKVVPYWYCRNSWTPAWANDGTFRIAMYPFNKISQFDKLVTINSSSGETIQGGGMILVTLPPEPIEKKKINQISSNFLNKPRLQDDDFYKKDPAEYKFDTDLNSKKINLNFINYLLFFIIIMLIFRYIYIHRKL
jgi:hypothetical protein